jgi:hypothetical protein
LLQSPRDPDSRAAEAEMTARLTRLALIAALLCGSGAHLAVLQGWAWAAMALRGARGGSVARAVTETFDGRHPCAVCAAVRRAAPTASLCASAPLKADLYIPAPASVPPPRRAPFAAARAELSPEGAAAPPPSPPPEPAAA